MSNLLFAMAVMLALAAVLGVLAARFYPRHPQTRILALTLVLVGMFAFLFYAAGRLYWAAVIEDSAVIVWSNWTPLLAAIAAGWTARLPGIPVWRRAIFSGALAVASVTAVAWPILGVILRPPPVGGNVWQDSVARQTSWATCSPAAAATLLRAEGIQASERELIPLCLTDNAGTPTLGLYRGIKLMAERAGRSVIVVQSTVDELLQSKPWPILLPVELPESGVEDPRYVEEWGWVPGLGHSVVALGQTDQGEVIIGDPSIGFEAWTEKDLRVLWHGGGIRLGPAD